MKKRKIKKGKETFFALFVLFFALLIFDGLSHSLAEVIKPEVIQCKTAMGQQDTSANEKEGGISPQLQSVEQRIQNYIEQRKEDLGENKFLARYRSVHGLLDLAHELELLKITDSIEPIYKAASNPSFFHENYFKGLEWDPYAGTRRELQRLRDGFFKLIRADTFNPSKRYFIRTSKKDVFLFRLNEEEWIELPIEDEEGFDIFADRVFAGDRKKAAEAAKAVLGGGELGIFGWQEIVDLALSGKETKISLADYPFQDMIYEMTYGYGSILENFFEKQGLPNLEYRVRGTTGDSFFVPQSTNEGQTEQRKVVVQFDRALTDDEHENIVVIKARFQLTLELLDNLLEHLDPNILLIYLNREMTLFPFLDGTKLYSAFIFFEANKEAIEKADKEGIYLFQIKGNRNYSVKLKQLNSDSFHPKDFAAL